MRNSEVLYEDNPNKYEDGTLRINRLKKRISLKVHWQDVSGKYHTDYYVPNTPRYVEQYHDVPDFYVCTDVEKSVRKALTHLPIHETWIEVWRTD